MDAVQILLGNITFDCVLHNLSKMKSVKTETLHINVIMVVNVEGMEHRTEAKLNEE